MCGAALVAQLVAQLVDLVSEVLVLPPEGISHISSLLDAGLAAEQLRGEATGLLLGVLQLSLQVAGPGRKKC